MGSLPYKISCKTNASLFARQQGKIVCMRPLGEIVRLLRQRNGWTLEELAGKVRRAGAKNVRHQHLQQLEARPNTSPRYIVELAMAFEKSVEELRSWEPGQPELGPSADFVGVRDEPTPYRPAMDLSEQERRLVLDHRQCSKDVQDAVLVILSAAKRKPRAAQAG